MWRMPRIELNGEEPVWLTSHLRDPQPEGERAAFVLFLTNYNKNRLRCTRFLLLGTSCCLELSSLQFLKAPH